MIPVFGIPGNGQVYDPLIGQFLSPIILKLLDISRLDITAQALIQYNINGKSLKIRR